MEIINDYLVIAVVLACLCVGFILKHLVPGKGVNKFIPLIMAVLGIALNVWINSFSFSPDILLGGMLSGLASTGLYEMFRQFIEAGVGTFFKKIFGGYNE